MEEKKEENNQDNKEKEKLDEKKEKEQKEKNEENVQEEKQEEKKEEEKQEEKKEEEKEERKEEENKKQEKEEKKEEERNELEEREREINNYYKNNKIKVTDIEKEKEKEQKINAINFNTNEDNSTYNNIINNNSKNLNLNLDNTSERKLCTNSTNDINKNINIALGSEDFYKLLPKIPKKNTPEFFTSSELNYLEYKHSCEYDRRNFMQIFSSILKEENNLVYSFSYCGDDYNLSLVKLSFFILQIILHITFSCLFFTDEIIDKIKDKKYEI